MSFQKISAWFLTENGKNFSFYAATTAALGSLFVNTLHHTVLIDYYKDFMHLYKKGFTVPLPKYLQERFEKALELAEVPEIDKPLFKPFSVYGFDVFSAGNVKSRFGVIVGLPINYTYQNVNSIDKSIIQVNQESVVWDLPEAKSFLNSLVLSENAQLYAMAKEIKFRQTPKLFIDTISSAVAIIAAFSLSNYFNTKLNLYVRPLPLRLILYCIVGGFVGGNYCFIKDFSQIYYEEQIDKELKAKNPIFAEGGKEFYNKILQRNVALRKLLGKEGEHLFTALGNENFFIRTKHLPLMKRKLFFEEDSKENELKS